MSGRVAIVCGSRDSHPGECGRDLLLAILAQFQPDAVIHGKATPLDSTDRWAGVVAESAGYRVLEFPADWSVGRSAGPIRNRQMADHASRGIGICIAFPGGIGTENMMKQARGRGVYVIDLRWMVEELF